MPLAAAPWEIDKAHTAVTFSVDHLGFSLVNGVFREFDATIDFDPENMESATISFTIQDSHLALRMRPLRRLQAAALDGPGRGLAFLLVEGLGNVATAAARTVLEVLGSADRERLSRLGVRFGVRHVYLPAMLKPRAIELRARLWAVHQRLAPSAVAVDRLALPVDGLPGGFAAAIGFEPLGEATCVRVDAVERLAARLRALAREGPFALPPDLLALTGLGAAELVRVVEALGYGQSDDQRYVRRRPRPARGGRQPAGGSPSHSPFAALRHIRVSG
jgi:ATP-dependent RNA helicase SUPV3L1/SUV3